MGSQDHFRAHGRLSVQINAVLRPTDAAERPVKIRDLGFGGAGVEVVDIPPRTSTSTTALPLDLDTGASVVLEVVAPVLWDPLHLHGRVAWTSPASSSDQPARAGICFDQPGSTTLLALFDVLGSD